MFQPSEFLKVALVLLLASQIARKTLASGDPDRAIRPALWSAPRWASRRRKYAPAEGMISILHLVAASRGGRPVILVNRFEGPTAETSVQAGLWASAQLGRRAGAAEGG